METEMELDDAPTRQSSKFSLGSSLSVFSADEQLDGEGPLTPTDKIQDDEDDDISSLADSPGSLSNEEVTDDEIMLDELHSEHDSASPLSSIPDDFPMSRSASPEVNEEETSEEKEPLKEEDILKEKEDVISKSEKLEAEEDEEEEDEDGEEEEAALLGTTSTRGRRKEAITRQQKLKQRKQKDNNKKVKSVGGQAKDKENEKETGSRRKRTKKESSSDKTEETKSKKQRTTEPKPRKGLNKQQRKEKQVEEEEVEDGENENDAFKEEKKEEIKVEESQDETKDEEEAMQDNKSEKETPAESSSHVTGDNDENKENIEQSDPEIKVDSHDQGHNDERRHQEALAALTRIELEFARYRDKVYDEKMSELNEEALSVANGTHPDLVASIAEIEEKKTKRLSSAEAWRTHQYANFKKQFEGFEYQANVHFIAQKNALRRNVLSGLNDKKWRIEDEHTKLNDSISAEQYPDRQQMVAHKQKQKDEMTELRDIRQTVGFPMAPVPTGLCAEDIDEDLRKFSISRHL